MIRFIKKFSLFLSPIALILAIPIIFFYYSYEAHHSIRHIIESNKNYIIGYNYSEHNYHFLKFYNIKYFTKREVLAIGSSRVLQFREKMFKKSFYNAGYTVSDVTNFYYFLKLIPKSKYPKYLLINVDEFFFNKPREKIKLGLQSKIPSAYSKTEDKISIYSAYLQFYQDVFFNITNFRKVINSKGKNEYGIKAILTHSGFRNDGSFAYSLVIDKLLKNDSTVRDYHFSEAYKRMNIKNDNIYQGGDTVNSYAVIILDSFLKFCSSNDIKVIGFLPPFANSVYKKMLETGKYHYFDSLENKIAPVFVKYNFEFYNYLDGSQVGADDSEMLDGMHPSEVIDHKILISMLRKKSFLNEVCDSDELKNSLSHKINRYTVYDY